jgi:hypothetical protein
VLVAGDAVAVHCASYYAAPHIEAHPTSETGVLIPLPAEFDDYIGGTRYKLDEAFAETPIVHRVGRDGATFTVVRSRHPPAP